MLAPISELVAIFAGLCLGWVLATVFLYEASGKRFSMGRLLLGLTGFGIVAAVMGYMLRC